jgi:ABC-type nickel/cobalt efflux system permease component RcnA
MWTPAIVSLIIQAVVAVVLVVAMTWIVLSPTATDEAAKAALVVIGSAMGYLFGKHSA